jgi:hypothetical protein
MVPTTVVGLLALIDYFCDWHEDMKEIFGKTRGDALAETFILLGSVRTYLERRDLSA